jgi:hypothetical protein
MTVSFASQRAIAPTDLNGVDFAFLAKPQRGVPWVSREQGKILVRELLNVCGQSVVTLPE